MSASSRSSKPANLTQQVSRAVAWNTLLAPLKTVTELAANIIILNILPLPHVGLLRLVSSAAASLGIWVDLGIDRSLPRFIPELEQHQGRMAVRRFMTVIFIIKALLLVVFSLVFLLLSNRFVAYLLNRSQQLPERFEAARAVLNNTIMELAPWLIGAVLALVILGSFYDGLMAYLISYFRQRAWNLIGLVGSVLQPTLAAILVLAGKGIAGVLIAMVVTPVVSVALATWQMVGSLKGCRGSGVGGQESGVRDQESGDRENLTPDTRSLNPEKPKRGLWSRFTIYALISNVLNLSDYVVSWYFAVFLLQNLALVAFFTTGTAMVRQALALLYTPLVGIQVPLFTRVRGGNGNLSDVYAAVGRILAMILIPGGVGLALLAHALILVQYPDYANATIVVYILTPCLFIESFLSSAQIVLQVYERYYLLMLPRLLTLLALPFIVWAALHYGLVGAAIAVGSGRVLTGLATAFLAQRAFPLRYSWAFFGRVSLAALGMALVVVGMKQVMGLEVIGTTLIARLASALVLLVIAAAGALSFGVILRLLGGLEAEDRQRILESRLPLRRWIAKVL